MKYASRLRGSSGLRSLEGTVAIHNETSLLVATGPESFVEMVESIVNACLARERARNPAPPMALPTAAEKIALWPIMLPREEGSAAAAVSPLGF